MMRMPAPLHAYLERDEDFSPENGAQLLDDEEFEELDDMLSDFEWDMPQLPVIAVDGGLGYFLLDADNKLAGGPNAIWWVERSDLSMDTAFIVAASFDAFIKMSIEQVDERWAPA